MNEPSLNFPIDTDNLNESFIYNLANQNMSEWAVDLATAQKMAADILLYNEIILKTVGEFERKIEVHCEQYRADQERIRELEAENTHLREQFAILICQDPEKRIMALEELNERLKHELEKAFHIIKGIT
ncbi:MAG: hypothetical protein LLG04_10970 [Parachlamydia sp.]|nr:hypothetical protein [Parachlamydia sp.]